MLFFSFFFGAFRLVLRLIYVWYTTEYQTDKPISGSWKIAAQAMSPWTAAFNDRTDVYLHDEKSYRWEVPYSCIHWIVHITSYHAQFHPESLRILLLSLHVSGKVKNHGFHLSCMECSFLMCKTLHQYLWSLRKDMRSESVCVFTRFQLNGDVWMKNGSPCKNVQKMCLNVQIACS